MSTEPPPGSGGQPPENDPFSKQPPPPGDRPPPPGGGPYGEDPHGTGSGPRGGSPYDSGPYGGGGPHGGDPHGGGGAFGDPLAGMPPLAESGRRTLARIIDLLLVGIVVWLISLAFGVDEYDMSGDDIDFGRSFGRSVVAAVLYIAYDTLMTAKNGQTLGKKLLKMRVANLENGATPSQQTALVRAAVLWIPFAFCCACIWTAISGGWSFFDRPYKQGLHDKAAKTVVVSTR